MLTLSVHLGIIILLIINYLKVVYTNVTDAPWTGVYND